MDVPKEKKRSEKVEADQKQLNNTVALTTDIEKGRMVYFANCVSCHNNNPKKPGSIGPEVYEVSIEVVEPEVTAFKSLLSTAPVSSLTTDILVPEINIMLFLTDSKSFIAGFAFTSISLELVMLILSNVIKPVA